MAGYALGLSLLVLTTTGIVNAYQYHSNEWYERVKHPWDNTIFSDWDRIASDYDMDGKYPSYLNKNYNTRLYRYPLQRNFVHRFPHEYPDDRLMSYYDGSSYFPYTKQNTIEETKQNRNEIENNAFSVTEQNIISKTNSLNPGHSSSTSAPSISTTVETSSEKLTEMSTDQDGSISTSNSKTTESSPRNRETIPNTKQDTSMKNMQSSSSSTDVIEDTTSELPEVSSDISVSHSTSSETKGAENIQQHTQTSVSEDDGLTNNKILQTGSTQESRNTPLSTSSDDRLTNKILETESTQESGNTPLSTSSDDGLTNKILERESTQESGNTPLSTQPSTSVDDWLTTSHVSEAEPRSESKNTPLSTQQSTSIDDGLTTSHVSETESKNESRNAILSTQPRTGLTNNHEPVTESTEVSESTSLHTEISISTDDNSTKSHVSQTESKISEDPISSTATEGTSTLFPSKTTQETDGEFSTLGSTSPTSESTSEEILKDHVIEIPSIRTARIVISAVFLVIALIGVAVLAIYVYKIKNRAVEYDQLLLLP